ncbi:hypothetical protein [Ilumatobacter sp.]|uniref:hypothetical protein n=1 Tax=Ilumatobacter sp. TaxID=1967498 RepID=UPI00375255E2
MTKPQYNPRVLKLLREEGWHATSVDYWDSFTRRTKDLFGCIDVLAVGVDGTIAVQVTSRGNMSSRRKKILTSEAYPFMKSAQWTIELWGYDQPKGPKTAYRLKRETL